MAVAAVLKVGAMLVKAGGAIAKGGKVAMKVGKKGAQVVAKKTKKTAWVSTHAVFLIYELDSPHSGPTARGAAGATPGKAERATPCRPGPAHVQCPPRGRVRRE